MLQSGNVQEVKTLQANGCRGNGRLSARAPRRPENAENTLGSQNRNLCYAKQGHRTTVQCVTTDPDLLQHLIHLLQMCKHQQCILSLHHLPLSIPASTIPTLFARMLRKVSDCKLSSGKLTELSMWRVALVLLVPAQCGSISRAERGKCHVKLPKYSFVPVSMLLV